MLIQFKKETTLQVVTEFDEPTDTIIEECEETFKEGEEVDVTLIPTDVSAYVDMQFGDGSLALGVHRDCFIEKE
jgi:hypothetical protein